MNSSSIMRSAAIFAVLAASLPAQNKPVLQESFESGKIDPAIWEERVSGTATLTVEPVEGARGKNALHVHYPDMPPRNTYAFIVATHLPDSVKTHFFGRAWMKITANVTPTHNPLIFAGEPGWPISKFDEIGLSRRDWMPSYQENKSAAGQGRGEVTYRTETNPPFDKWFLLEWEFNDDPAAITMWVDGEQLSNTMSGEKVDMVKFTWPKGSTTASGLVGGYKEFGFGIRAWQAPMNGFDVYYDDIAIGTSRIGPAK
jgi:hypothetical protein